jgi:hypothetical protein
VGRCPLFSARPAVVVVQVDQVATQVVKEVRCAIGEEHGKTNRHGHKDERRHNQHNEENEMSGPEINVLGQLLRDFWAFLVAEKTWLAGVVGWSAGTLVTNWLGLSRERRTERNADAKVLRERVMILLAMDRSSGLYDRLTPADIDGLRQHLSCLGRRRLDAAYRDYQQACDQGVTQDAAGQVERNNASEVRARLRAIGKLAKRV